MVKYHFGDSPTSHLAKNYRFTLGKNCLWAINKLQLVEEYDGGV